jgi:hypothetical protein
LSSAKEKRGKERSEEKKKKRKEVRGDPHIKGCESQILKSRSRSTMKLGEIVEDYKTLLFSKFQKKRICFVRVMRF